MIRLRAFSLFASCFIASAVMANPAQQAFEQFVQTVSAAKGQFSQYTVGPPGAAMGSSPAAILFGTGDMTQAFEVTPLPDQDGLSWFRAVPRQPESGLNKLDIGMRAGNPARLLLLDGFGQTTQIDLSNIRAQSSFPPDTFQFKAPPKTDVIKLD